MKQLKLNWGGGNNRLNNHFAFTLAEVLITLVIIGVVAALTIPGIIVSYQKNQYATQLKKEYNYLSNGFKEMMARDGVTRISDTVLWSKIKSKSTAIATGFNSTKFNDSSLLEELKKSFNVVQNYPANKMPTADGKVHYSKLNSNDDYTTMSNGLLLADGSFLYFQTMFFNPVSVECGDHACASLKEFQQYRNTPTKFWQQIGRISIDINGLKGPNKIGRDFFTFFIDNDGSLYPFYGPDHVICSFYWSYASASNPANLSSYCSITENNGTGCAARIMAEGWKMNY